MLRPETSAETGPLLMAYLVVTLIWHSDSSTFATQLGSTMHFSATTLATPSKNALTRCRLTALARTLEWCVTFLQGGRELRESNAAGNLRQMSKNR